jgi:hypothetical protein
MGNSLAVNTASEATDLMVSAATDNILNCKTAIDQIQGITVIAQNGSSINIGDIDWSQVVAYNQSCYQNATATNTISTSIQQEAQQIAKAIQQQWAVFTAAEAVNMSDLVIKLSEQVCTEYTTKCAAEVIQTQTATFYASGGSEIATGILNWDQTVNGISKCVQQTSTVTNAQNNLSNNITQQATAEIQNFLMPLIIAAVIILVVVILLVFGGPALAQLGGRGGQAQGTTGGGESLQSTATRTIAEHPELLELLA